MSRTVLVVDDQHDVRRQVCLLVEAVGHAVVGEASNVRDALRLCSSLRPDVVLLDVRLPDGTGLDVARAVRTWEPRPIVVLVSTADYSDVVESCGAHAFIVKSALDSRTIHAAIESA